MGLQLFMVIGKQNREMKFRVLDGPGKTLLGMGAVGRFSPPSGLGSRMRGVGINGSVALG